MAAASGLHLVPMDKRNPWSKPLVLETGSYLSQALDLGVHHIIFRDWWSATNDGGAGMLQALGLRLLDKMVNLLTFGGAALSNLAELTDG